MSHRTAFRLAQLRAAISALQRMIEHDRVADDYATLMALTGIVTDITAAHIKRCCRVPPGAAHLAPIRAEFIELWAGIECDVLPRLVDMVGEIRGSDDAT